MWALSHGLISSTLKMANHIENGVRVSSCCAFFEREPVLSDRGDWLETMVFMYRLARV